MVDIHTLISRTSRPGLLIRAARHALAGYSRDRYLRRILNEDATPTPDSAARKLLELEELHDEMRRTANAAYSVQRHIEVLCALMHEAALLRSAAAKGARDRSSKASDAAAILRAV